MALHPRPALVFFDPQYRITQIDEVAQQLLGPGSARCVGQPLAAALHDLEAGLDEILQAGSGAAGRYMSGSTTLAGQSWRIEFILLPQDCGGVLMMRQDDSGVAKLLHDLRTPLNAMVGWLHLLGMDGDAAANGRPRALTGLRRAVDQQRQMLDDWNGSARPARPAGDASGAAGAAGEERPAAGRPAAAGEEPPAAGRPAAAGKDAAAAVDATAVDTSTPGTGITEFDPAMPGTAAPGTTISGSASPGTAAHRSTAPGSAAGGSDAPGTAGLDSTSPSPPRPGTRPHATALPGHAPPGTTIDGSGKPGTVVHDTPAPGSNGGRAGTAAAPGGIAAGSAGALGSAGTPRGPGAAGGPGTSAIPPPGRNPAATPGHDPGPAPGHDGARHGHTRHNDTHHANDAHRDSPLAGVFILAVDDNREMLHALESLLGRCGAVVETVTSAEAALKRYASWAAGGGERLLVSDLAMPQRDGLSLVKEIRKLERLHSLPRLPAIALSAHARPEARREAFASGFDLFLAKPVDPPVLLGHLRNMLDR